jgi:hypothetical protein
MIHNNEISENTVIENNKIENIKNSDVEKTDVNLIENELDDEYVFHPSVDSSGYDIKQVNISIPELKKLCNELPYAVAFNTNGWIKYKIRSEQDWCKYPPLSCFGLYVKRNIDKNLIVPVSQTKQWFEYLA